MRARAPRGETAPRRRGGARLWLAGLVGILGLSLLAYPTVLNGFYDRRVAAIEEEFLRAHQAEPGQPAPHEELYQFLRAENERLFQTGQAGLVDAFSYETTHVDLSDYGIADNRIGFLSIPAIGIDLPIYLGASRENLRLGAVHLTQTSYPIGGDNANAVIAAHRGSAVVMFRNIHKIERGDEIIITNFRGRLVYRAVDAQIIRPDQTDQIMIQPGRDLLTLLSCDPIGGHYLRYVLYAERVV